MAFVLDYYFHIGGAFAAVFVVGMAFCAGGLSEGDDLGTALVTPLFIIALLVAWPVAVPLTFVMDYIDQQRWKVYQERDKSKEHWERYLKQEGLDRHRP